MKQINSNNRNSIIFNNNTINLYFFNNKFFFIDFFKLEIYISLIMIFLSIITCAFDWINEFINVCNVRFDANILSIQIPNLIFTCSFVPLILFSLVHIVTCDTSTRVLRCITLLIEVFLVSNIFFNCPNYNVIAFSLFLASTSHMFFNIILYDKKISKLERCYLSALMLYFYLLLANITWRAFNSLILISTVAILVLAIILKVYYHFINEKEV